MAGKKWNTLRGYEEVMFKICDLEYISPNLWEGYKNEFEGYYPQDFWDCLDENVNDLYDKDIIGFEIRFNDADYSAEVEVWIENKEAFDQYIYDSYWRVDKVDTEWRQQELDEIAYYIKEALKLWEKKMLDRLIEWYAYDDYVWYYNWKYGLIDEEEEDEEYEKSF